MAGGEDLKMDSRDQIVPQTVNTVLGPLILLRKQYDLRGKAWVTFVFCLR